MDALLRGNLFPIFQTGFEGNGDGDGDGDGGNGDGNGDGSGEFSQSDIDSAVEKAVGGLKTTNAALKEEKTKVAKSLKGLQTQMDALGGEEGIKKLAEFQQKLSEDESTKLLSEGKHEEWFDRRTAALRKDHENQLATVTESETKAIARAEKAEVGLIKQVLKADVLSAAKDSGTVPEASGDIQLRAERAFSWDEEKETLVMKDSEGGVLFGKDGKKPKTVVEWLDEQKETARHWWPLSKGGGAGGADDAGKGGDEDISQADFGTFKEKRMKQKAARRKTQGFAT